ncbi:MAG: glycerophosphodiester phosphodiesterase [Clostridia bacterium]
MKIKTAIIAHRGASAYAPENTLAAFQKAYEMGADGIEIDVLFSKDGHIMVHHDFHLGRCEECGGMVKDHTYFELRKLDVGAWFDEAYKGQKIPSIEEVMQFVKDKNMLLNIEIKTGSPYDAGIEKQLVKIVRKYDICDQIIYSSFNHYSLVYIKKLHDESRIAALTSCAMVNPWEYLKLHDFDGYHPNQLAISDKIIEKLINKNIFVNPYTVNDEDRMKRFMTDNVSGIITDVPDIAVRVRNEMMG